MHLICMVDYSIFTFLPLMHRAGYSSLHGVSKESCQMVGGFGNALGGANRMKKLIITLVTVSSMFTAGAALAEEVCINWNGIVLCGEKIH